MFSTSDFKDGFYQVPLEEGSTKFTAVVPHGHYEFLRVPMGLCNSPSVFQRNIRTIFRTLIVDRSVLSYSDDLNNTAFDSRYVSMGPVVSNFFIFIGAFLFHDPFPLHFFSQQDLNRF